MVVYLFAGRCTRKEKVRQRRNIELEDAALSEKTKTRYYLALRKLLPYFESAECLDDLDNKICTWMRVMWKAGEPLLTVGDGLSAIQHFEPSTKKRLPHAWKLFTVWRKVEIPSRAPPLTRVLVRSMAVFEMENNRLDMTVMLLLGFFCLLRTGELLQLTVNDFCLGHSSGLVSLKHTKSGRRDNASEFVSFTDIPTLEAVKQLISLRKETNTGPRLWVHSPSSFRQQFKLLCDHYDLSSHQFRPYSLRRGGATHHFQITNSMEAALIKGRWQSSKVARIYISDGLSYLPNLKMSTRTTTLIKRFHFFSPHLG